jgi:DNA-binding MarR family transcriptional regulator
MPSAEPRYQDHVAYRVKRLYLLASQSLDDLLKPYGLGRSQWQVLSRLCAEEGRSQRDLQTAMKVEPATLSAIVESLVSKGWVERAENPADRRGRLLRLTPQGAEQLARTPDPMRGLEARMLDGLSADQRLQLQDTLATMIASLERGRVE